MFNDKLTHVLVRGFFVWLLIVAAETVHGIARRFLLEPFIGDFRARQIAEGGLLPFGLLLMMFAPVALAKILDEV